MNKYELAVVVSAKIEDDERAAVVDKCKALVERFGGQITNVDEWGKRKLAYPIDFKTEGYYVLVNFASNPEFPKELERIYGITDGVMRFITVRKEA